MGSNGEEGKVSPGQGPVQVRKVGWPKRRGGEERAWPPFLVRAPFAAVVQRAWNRLKVNELGFVDPEASAMSSLDLLDSNSKAHRSRSIGC